MYRSCRSTSSHFKYSTADIDIVKIYTLSTNMDFGISIVYYNAL